MATTHRWPAWLMAAAVLVVVILLSRIANLCERRARRRYLAGRDAQPVERLILGCRDTDDLSAADLRAAWLAVAQGLGVPAELLRPDDRLADLAGLPSWLVGFTDSHTDLGWLLEDLDYVLADQPGTDCPAKIDTVGELVTWLTRARWPRADVSGRSLTRASAAADGERGLSSPNAEGDT